MAASPQRAPLPVIAMHGMDLGADMFDKAVAWILAAHPDTKVYPLRLLERSLSVTTPLGTQVSELTNAVRTLIANDVATFADGYHLMCFSEGALLCRVITQLMDDHKVHTLIAVAGPQLGVYGASWFIHNKPVEAFSNIPFFGPVVNKMMDSSYVDFYELAYDSTTQRHCAPAELWNDPFHQAQFLHDTTFLPFVNGLNEPVPQGMRDNFLRVRNAVFLAGSMAHHSGDSDFGVQPWCTGVFGYWDVNSTEVMVPMERQKVYMEDTFGLKSMHEAGKLNVTHVPGVVHSAWFTSEDVFSSNILPHLT